MPKAGEFEIKVWGEGYPVHCEIIYRGEYLARINHSELSDLQYTIEKAMKIARSELPDQYKDEV